MANPAILLLVGILASATLSPVVVGQSVVDIVTPAFFDGIINKARPDCAGKGFYSRDAFLEALNSYSGFGQASNPDDSKREIAAFFAHVTHETGFFCYIEEISRPFNPYCDESDESKRQYPCVAGKEYYGRGPLQISYNYNYGEAGEAIRFDGLNAPETVATVPVISFKTALWFWMKNVHPVVTSGFGATIEKINSIECTRNGGNGEAVGMRVQYYTEYCNQFSVSPGENLTC